MSTFLGNRKSTQRSPFLPRLPHPSDSHQAGLALTASVQAALAMPQPQQRQGVASTESLQAEATLPPALTVLSPGFPQCPPSLARPPSRLPFCCPGQRPPGLLLSVAGPPPAMLISSRAVF